MTLRRSAGLVAVAACLLAAATGCGLDSSAAEGCAEPADGPIRPALPPPSGPTYAGPDGAADAAPLPELRAQVQLIEESGWFVGDVLARADGGAYVALRGQSGSRLVTVAPAGAGFEVTGSVELVAGAANHMALLSDGTVLLTGPVPTAGTTAGGEAAYGVTVVDPATGRARPTPLVAAGSDEAVGRSVLAGDGATVFTYVRTDGGADPQHRLFAVDSATGELRAERNLSADLTGIDVVADHFSDATLLPSTADGVRLAGNVTSGCADAVPLLLSFDGALEPAGPPLELVRDVGLWPGLSLTTVSDGTVFAGVTPENGGIGQLVAVPPGGRPSLVARFEQEGQRFGWRGLAVLRAGSWALVPTVDGARVVDLTGRERSGRVRLPCLAGSDGTGPSEDLAGIHLVVPDADGDGALMVGDCDEPSSPLMLWIVD
jgi:hypothetical protein